MTATAKPARRRGNPKSAGFTYSALSAVIMVLLAALTITASTTPPPAIAELAPQAVQQIKDAPQEQSSELGSAAGGAGSGEFVATTTTAPAGAAGGGPLGVTTTTEPIVERARVRRCVGDPPRQTEDPQSPPCVPFWQGDNGGETTRGVTGTEIRLGMGGGATDQTARIYEAYFNKRYEFYGRRLKIYRVDTADGQDCASQKAAVTAAAQEHELFAVIDSASFGTSCFHEEAARQKMVSALTNVLFSEAEMKAVHPYLWQYIMGHEKLFASIGEMVCARLAGGNAVHSGDAVFRLSERKFGVILQEATRDRPIDMQPLHDAMAKCDAKSDETIVIPPNANGDEYIADVQNAVLRMRSENITTVICLCLIFNEAYFSPTATSHGYFPEWIMSSYMSNDWNILLKLFWSAEHRKSIFGVSAMPRQRLPKYEPAAYAAAEVAPEVRYIDIAQALNTYRTLLLMASGIQMAGPNLTAQTFGAALHKTKFPNPPDPTGSGTVGFLDGDHSMTDDLTEIWWSENAMNPNEDKSPGAYCYVDGGARRFPGQWPTDGDPFFRPPCDSGA